MQIFNRTRSIFLCRANLRAFIFVCLFVAGQGANAGETVTIAGAADLKFAMDEIIVSFKRANPAAQIEAIYGSSGQLSMQIRQGAPYDLFFSADMAYPRALKEEGFSASDVRLYAVGHIVLWSLTRNAGALTLKDLADPGIQKVAMANPQHAPYGKRAEEALKAAGVWDTVEPKLVFGENIAQAAQYVQGGNAQVGIISLSLALSPELVKQGKYVPIPDNLHQPLEQGYIMTKRASNNPLAVAFAHFVAGEEARSIMSGYGFVLPSAGQ